MEQSLATFAAALAAVISAACALLSFLAANRNFRRSNEPYVFGYARQDALEPARFEVIISNIGREPAFDVVYEIQSKKVSSDGIWPDRQFSKPMKMSVIPPDGSIRYEIGALPRILLDEPDWCFNIKVSFLDRLGKRFEARTTVSVGDFERLSLGKHPIQQTADQLEKLVESFRRIVTPFGLSVLVTDKEKHTTAAIKRAKDISNTDDFKL